jgi:hypothetical protein
MKGETIMVVKNLSFIFAVFAIFIMGLTVYPALADDSTIDKKAAAIEKYKAELAAKAAKKNAEKETEAVETITETVETTIETEVVEIKDETTETIETTIETEVAEIKDEAAENEEIIEAASEHPTEAVKKEVESLH